MSILLLHANNRNKEYDKLSSLSLVASLILIVDPMQLFNISFILSFVSILSIILLMPLFERLLSKVFFEKVSSAISVSLAVCLGITAFQIYYFGTASLLGIISNIITIPIVGFLFIFLLISVVIGSIFGFVRPLVQAFGYGMKYVVQFNNWIAQNGICLRFDGVGVISLVISIALMFIVSDYLFLRKRYKIPIVCLLSLLLVIAVI